MQVLTNNGVRSSTNSAARSTYSRGRLDPTMPQDKGEEYALEVAARIVSARKEEGLTQVELAELIGVSNRSMQGYENAEVIPYRKMKDLARVLNRPVEWLLHGDDAVTPADERLEAIEKNIELILKRLSK